MKNMFTIEFEFYDTSIALQMKYQELLCIWD